MLKNQRIAARAVYGTLLPAERSQDRAAIDATRCLLAVLEGRQAGEFRLDTGIDAISLLSEASAKAIDARNLMVQAHAELASVADEVGIDVRSWGPTRECPEPGFAGAHTTVVPLLRSA
jgi:hypothetical protein